MAIRNGAGVPRTSRLARRRSRRYVTTRAPRPQLKARCWWCGGALEDGARLLLLYGQDRFCCRECAHGLDVPGLYLG